MIRLALAILLAPLALIYMVMLAIFYAVELTALGLAALIAAFVPQHRHLDRPGSPDLAKRASAGKRGPS
jgi:hypothetical protein